MKQLLEEAKLGTHEKCRYCPWNPITVGPIAFGESCTEHGINWSSSGQAKSMQVVQDPAGTTPGTTGRLCFVHNSKNLSDKTARHAFDLWKATVAFDSTEVSDPYLKNHYWTNALLHGADKITQKQLRNSTTLIKARRCCAQLLKEQIKLLSPKVIFANGEYAVTSLFELGYISSPWEKVKQVFSLGPYHELITSADGNEINLFCTFHTAITPINTHIAHLYTAKLQSILDERLENIRRYTNVSSFLNKYSLNDSTGKGMRVLLLHWIDIGTAIREANK